MKNFILIILIITGYASPTVSQMYEEFYEDWPVFKEAEIEDRRFKHADIMRMLEDYKSDPEIKISTAGHSIEGRAIKLVKFGEGPIPVLLWSQMHGDEPTATMALMDIFNFLTSDDERFEDFREKLKEELSIYFLPLLNPDGAERYERRNSIGIDLNRDALRLVTPEARLLKSIRDSLEPVFGFNLHDQSRYYAAGPGGDEVTIAFLAPAFNFERDWNEVRSRAMQLTVEMADALKPYIPHKIGRYSDAFEPRAFGDNMQKWGTSTVLIESGALKGDREKQRIRRLNFMILLESFRSIMERDYKDNTIDDYERIPYNNRSLVDYLFKEAQVIYKQDTFLLDIAINTVEVQDSEDRDYITEGEVVDIGHLHQYGSYHRIDLQDDEYLIPAKKLFDFGGKDIQLSTFKELCSPAHLIRRNTLSKDGKIDERITAFIPNQQKDEKSFYIRYGSDPAFFISRNGEMTSLFYKGNLYQL